jgi:hypothetical protein
LAELLLLCKDFMSPDVKDSMTGQNILWFSKPIWRLTQKMNRYPLAFCERVWTLFNEALKNARIVRTQNFAASIDIFNQSQVDALAGLKPNLIDSMHKLPEGRFLHFGLNFYAPRFKFA